MHDLRCVQASELLNLEIINTQTRVKYQGATNHCDLDTYAAVVEKDIKISDVAANVPTTYGKYRTRC